MSACRVEPSWNAARDADGAWTLTFDRPDARQNTLDTNTLRELLGLLAAIAGDPGTTRVVITSAKDRGFCAGADLRALAEAATPEDVAAFARLGQAAFERLRALSVPTIAVLHGACLGGGLELALACRTLRLRDHPAAPLSIGTPEVRLGLVPGWGAIGALPQRVDLKAALNLLLEGQPIGAEEALAIGLVDEVDSDPSRTVRVRPPEGSGDPGADAESASALDEARRRAGDDPARRRILDVLEADRAGGWAAGLEAAARGLAEMAFTPAARAAIAAFLARKA